MTHPNRIAYYRDRCDPPLTQAELAARLDVHANTVQNWERRGVARPEALLRLARLFVERGALATYHDAAAFWQSAARGGHQPPPELRALFARGAPAGAAALALPLGALPAPARSCGALPYPRNERFTGREADLRVLAALLRPAGAVAAVCGVGGLGKTQLAVMFAYHYGAHFPGGIHWIDAEEPAGIAAQVAASGDDSLHPAFARLGFARRLELVKAAWREPAPRLLIFDNCEDPAALFEWRPVSGGCRILVTSRTRAWADYEAVQLLDLQPIARAASVALLRAYGAIHGGDDLALGQIAAALGDLPLALHLAGRHLADSGESAASYAAYLERPRPLRHRSLQGCGLSPTDYSWSLADAFARSYARLGDGPLDTLARAILGLIRFLAPAAPIPQDFLLEALELPPGQLPGARAALQHLGEHISLIELQPERQTVRVHPLVHAFLNEGPPSQERYRALVRAVHRRATAANESGVAFSEALALQLRHLADQARASGAPEAAELWTDLAWPLTGAGEFEAARHYGEGSVQLCEQHYGPEHPRTAEALNNLALILQIFNAYKNSELLYQRALAIWERACGPESAEVGSAYNNLGFLAILRARHAEAEGYLRRALGIRRRLLGLRSTGTARCIHNLGHLALRTGRLRRAERYLGLALAIREEILPAPSSATGTTLALLAETKLARGDLAGARRYAEAAHAMRFGAVAAESDESGASAALFGAIAHAAGDLERAAALYEQAVRLRSSMLGPEAPEAHAESVRLAGAYLDLGRAAEARALLARALAGLRASVGEESLFFQAARAEWRRLEAAEAARVPAHPTAARPPASGP